MKKVIVFLMLLGSAFTLKAQNDAIERFFNKYTDDPNFSYAIITGKMFSLFTHMEGQSDEDQALLHAIASVKGLKVLAAEDTEKGNAYYDEAFKVIPTKEYDELMTVKDEDGKMKFFIKEDKGIVSELLMIRGGNHEFMIMSLVGNIDLKQISKLAKYVDVNGFEHFENVDKKNDEQKH